MTVFFPAAAQHKNLVKLMVSIWSQAVEETHRVQGFLILNKLLLLRPDLLDQSMKKMYLAYVSNSKFVNAQTLPHIYFMQTCLIEIYKRDIDVR